nr:MAG TPA: hypothetical protein [Caudoviricetes sp.]
MLFGRQKHTKKCRPYGATTNVTPVTATGTSA